MAGRGTRFATEGYSLPKPLIDVNGRPMISWVIENLQTSIPTKFTFVALREHENQYELSSILRKYAPSCKIVWVEAVTSGAAQSALLGCKVLPLNSPLVIANSDQFVSQDLTNFLREAIKTDGLIMTMPSNDPKWSYVILNEKKEVVRVVEKEVVSNLATVGIYGFRTVNSFVHHATAMIESQEKVNGEYYVAPVYNRIIKSGRTIRYFDVGKNMHGIGTPSDLLDFKQWISSSTNT